MQSHSHNDLIYTRYIILKQKGIIYERGFAFDLTTTSHNEYNWSDIVATYDRSDFAQQSYNSNVQWVIEFYANMTQDLSKVWV